MTKVAKKTAGTLEYQKLKDTRSILRAELRNTEVAFENAKKRFDSACKLLENARVHGGPVMRPYRVILSVNFEAKDLEEAILCSKKLKDLLTLGISSDGMLSVGFRAKVEQVDYEGGDLVRLDSNGKKIE